MNIYSRMIDLLQHQLTETGVRQDTAIYVSARAIESLRNEIGGREVYLPRRHPWAGMDERNRSIRATFNGRNIANVCSRYALSRSSIYRICRKK